MIDTPQAEQNPPEPVEKCRLIGIHQRFKALLLQACMSQQQLADKIGRDKSYISKVVRGLISPAPHIRIKIAKILNCDTSVIWGGPE